MHELTGLLREYDRARAYTDQLWKDLAPDEVTRRPRTNSPARSAGTSAIRPTSRTP